MESSLCKQLNSIMRLLNCFSCFLETYHLSGKNMFILSPGPSLYFPLGRWVIWSFVKPLMMFLIGAGINQNPRISCFRLFELLNNKAGWDQFAACNQGRKLAPNEGGVEPQFYCWVSYALQICLTRNIRNVLVEWLLQEPLCSRFWLGDGRDNITLNSRIYRKNSPNWVFPCGSAGEGIGSIGQPSCITTAIARQACFASCLAPSTDVQRKDATNQYIPFRTHREKLSLANSYGITT